MGVTVDEVLGRDPVSPEETGLPRLHYLFLHFLDLSESRPVGMMAPGAIPYSEIYAYSVLCGIMFGAWEVTAIRQLDSMWLNVFAENRKREQKQ